MDILPLFELSDFILIMFVFFEMIIEFGNEIIHSVMYDSLWPHGLCLPGSSVYGILQRRILEWVTIPFSRGSSKPRDWTQCISFIGRWTLYQFFSHQWSPMRLYTLLLTFFLMLDWPNVLSGFSITVYKKPKWTFWSTY